MGTVRKPSNTKFNDVSEEFSLPLLVRSVSLGRKQATSKQKTTLNLYQTTRCHIRKIVLVTVSDVRILNLTLTY
jgi:hypothetical protein